MKNVFCRNVYRDYHLNQDPTALYPVARALLTIQAVYGTIPHIYGKGRGAKQITDFLTKLRFV